MTKNRLKKMIVGGIKCGPAQQGLAHAIDDDAAAGRMQRHPIQRWKAEPTPAIPGVHIAPPGARDRMPMRWAESYWVVGRWWNGSVY